MNNFMTRTVYKNQPNRGAVLLVMLIVIFTGTVLSLGFLSRSDLQLAASNNTTTRCEIDYLAESGLDYAKVQILSPQGEEDEYWSGVTGEQLVPDSDNFCDVNVIRVNSMDYEVISRAYQQKDSEKTARSSLKSRLRLDPCIGYYQKDKKDIYSKVDITGDVYCGGDVTVYGNIDGDVYSKGWIANPNNNITGSREEYESSPPVSPPGISTSDYSSSYYYNGGGPYSVKQLLYSYYVGEEEGSGNFIWEGYGNPGKVYYRDGSLELYRNVYISGTLVVKDDLKLKNNCNITIKPVKNMPALIVGHDIKIDDDYQDLNIEGYVQVGHHIDMHGEWDMDIKIKGALYILGDGIMNIGPYSDVDITAYPDSAALRIWESTSSYFDWTPAAGAFFKDLKRLQ